MGDLKPAMRALTLKPHWAHAVAHLGKRIENRSRPFPKGMQGQRIAIHAGASLPKGWADELRRADPGNPVNGAIQADCYYRVVIAPKMRGARLKRPDERQQAIATRAIVATAELFMCKPALDLAAPRFVRWADPSAAWWWSLVRIVTLATPVPVQRGQLGLWRLDAETERRVREVGNG